MSKPLDKILTWIADNLSKDMSKMIIATGAAGWILSSTAQISALAMSKKIDPKDKSFLIPQEFADALVNIGAFLVITLSAQKLASKLFTTGIFATEKVRSFLEKNKHLYGNKIGRLDFNLDHIKNTAQFFPLEEYTKSKDVAKTLATVAGGILSSNIIAPIIRNNMAAKAQQNYLNTTSKTELNKPDNNNKTIIKQPVTVKTQITPSTFRSYDMRI